MSNSLKRIADVLNWKLAKPPLRSNFLSSDGLSQHYLKGSDSTRLSTALVLDSIESTAPRHKRLKRSSEFSIGAMAWQRLRRVVCLQIR